MSDLPFDANFRSALDASPCPMVLVDPDGAVRLLNRAAEDLFGHPAHELVGQSVDVLLPDEERSTHKVSRGLFHNQPTRRPMGKMRDLTALKRDGTFVHVEVGLNPIATAQGTFVLAAVVDLTERKRIEQRATEQARQLRVANAELTTLATTDTLTKLWNRRAFMDQIVVQMEQAVRRREPLSLLILDLDRFKDYNDEFGHLAGDEVLVQAAALVRDCARRADFAARIGGEEFCVLMADTERESAMLVAERIRAAIDIAAFPRRKVTVSGGAATIRFEDGKRPDEDWRTKLLTEADQALYHAKHHGRNRVVHVEEMP